MEMYAGRVACCPLVSRVKYAPQALLRLEIDKTDGHVPECYIMFTTRHNQRNNKFSSPCQLLRLIKLDSVVIPAFLII